MAETIETTQPRALAAPDVPTVSICIPTFNGALWIREAIESALAQDFGDIEVVVCDDASTDDTVAVARQFDDPRVSVVVNRERVGMARNWNRSMQASRGGYVKPLMQDDKLAPDCIGRMLEVMRESPRIGMLFAPREIELDDPADPASILFRERFGRPHTRLGQLARVNDGRTLFATMERDRFRDNLVGEPTSVLVSREALVRLGLFNVKLRQLTDLEMWLRIAYFYDVGFVSAPLATFRVHKRSASVANERSGSGWLDRVWLLEGLRAHPEIRRGLSWRRVARLWLLTYANAGKRLFADGPHALRPHVRELGDYLRFRLGRRRGDALHEPLVARKGTA
ncbi:MAG: glycosyltransferase family 2 protein [Candidatus Limnocylindrales bacterium]